MTPEADAFATFAAAYPHEAHETWPDRFWAYFQRVRPGVSRETMERVLRETATKGAEGMSKVRRGGVDGDARGGRGVSEKAEKMNAAGAIQNGS